MKYNKLTLNKPKYIVAKNTLKLHVTVREKRREHVSWEGGGDGGLAKAVSGGGKEIDNEKEGQCESENV